MIDWVWALLTIDSVVIAELWRGVGFLPCGALVLVLCLVLAQQRRQEALTASRVAP